MPARQKTPPADEPRARLVEAAIEQIEQRGLARLTVRDIAAAAEANIAAVNYYFGSKDALVREALDGTIRSTLEDLEEILEGAPKDPERSFTELIAYLMEGSRRYPRISKAHLHDAFSADDYSGPFPTGFAPVLVRVRDTLRDVVPGLDRDGAARRTIAAVSAAFYPSFFSGMFRDLGALVTERERQEYAAEAARHMLAPVQRKPTRARKT